MTIPAFSPRARRDLLAAVDRISRDNPHAADALLIGAERTAELVTRRPGVARERPDFLTMRYRFFAIRGLPYLLVFETDATPILVVRVLHQSRDLLAVLPELDEV